jgi:hypothetical protein
MGRHGKNSSARSKRKESGHTGRYRVNMKVIASNSESDFQVRLDYESNMENNLTVKTILKLMRALPNINEWEYDPY